MARGVVSEGRFGCTLSSAGDVDGDGFGDVVLGGTRLAASSNNAIQAWLFRGGPTGLRTEPEWMFEQSVAFAVPGVTVQALGDVNRDRLADGAVAAWLHQTPGGHEGQEWGGAGSERGPSGSMLRADTPQVARGWYPRPPALPGWRWPWVLGGAGATLLAGGALFVLRAWELRAMHRRLRTLERAQALERAHPHCTGPARSSRHQPHTPLLAERAGEQ